MEYEVRISLSAEDDVDDILAYIAEKLANPQAASDFADELEARYKELSHHPLMYEQSSNERLRTIGYRRFIIRNYLVFYLVDDEQKTVIIARVFYGGRNYENYL
jgi:plasmid stabilization system protein ParE